MRRLAIAAAAAALLAPAARADSNTAAELAALAADVKALLDQRGESAVCVGPFRGVGDGRLSSAGPAVAKGLSDELARLGVAVRLRANLTVTGTLRPVLDAASGLVAVELRATFEDAAGEPQGTLNSRLRPRGVFGDAAVASLVGLTVSLPPGADAAGRADRVRRAAEEPAARVDGSVVRAPGGPFGVEILVKGREYAPRAAELREGFAFVPLARDEAYAVRLVNDGDREAAARLTIDGLSLFAVSEVRDPATGRPKYEHVLVPARGSVTVRGWHVTNDESDEFLVTAFPRSLAAQLGGGADVGTVTATFAAAWPKGSPPPADEPAAPGRFARSADDATGRGVRFGRRYEEQARDIGVVRAAVSVRYRK